MTTVKVRKKFIQLEDSGHEHVEELWIFSYADMITILMTFFILIISISNVSNEKYQKLKQAISHTDPKENNSPGQTAETGESRVSSPQKQIQSKGPTIAGVSLENLSKAAAETGGDRMAQLTEGARLLLAEIDPMMVQKEKLEISEFSNLKNRLSQLVEIQKSNSELIATRSQIVFRFDIHELVGAQGGLLSEGRKFVRELSRQALKLKTTPLIRVELEPFQWTATPVEKEKSKTMPSLLQLVTWNQILVAGLVQNGFDPALIKSGVAARHSAQRQTSLLSQGLASVKFTVERRPLPPPEAKNPQTKGSGK